MHAWIFRHRKRLSAVFGMVTGEAALPEDPPRRDARSAGDAAPDVDAADGAVNRLGIPPGTVARRERYVVLAPMPRRSA